jgi:4-aminobutyrate aminotransferase-like enzyme
MFTCTGSESNDLAIPYCEGLHRRGRNHCHAPCVSRDYRRGIEAVAVAWANVPRGTFVRTVAAPDLYRSKTGDVGAEFASQVRVAIADLRSQGVRIAALICDTIFSNDGILADPPGFLRGAVEAVRSEGGLFIADEVQAGFARTGEAMWGFQRHGVIPDIVTMGKPMGNGHPIAGVVVKPGLVEEFGRTARYFNTFGRNPVACAAALATLNVSEDDHLVENWR